MVTPTISGLVTPAVLQSMLAHGIVSAAGDNSNPSMTPVPINPNPYYGSWADKYTDANGRQVCAYHHRHH